MSNHVGRIAAELSAYLAERGQGKLLGCEVELTHERAFSTVAFLRVRTSRGERKFAMKTVVHHPINREIVEARNQAVVEFEALSRLYPVFELHRGCRVPRPILVVPELETFVMEQVAGDLLMDRFRACRYLAPKRDFERLREWMFLVGRWLKVLQEHTGYRSGGSESLALVVSRAEQRLRLVEEHDGGSLPRGFGAAAWALLRAECGKVMPGEVLVCGRHGDFTPLNVIASDDGITVIDYLGYDEDCAAVDLMKILVFLEDEGRSMTTSPWKPAALRDSFLKGFGEVPALPRHVLVVCEGMQRLVSMWGALSAGATHLHHGWESRSRVKAHARWFMEGEPRKLLWPASG